mmetsp:Transcript_22386/g.39589  ORF Transcript_22386/g.39589 Transcript_22386/m.39589 type:complete len:132 (+) Transcript_22386:82-477(+)
MVFMMYVPDGLRYVGPRDQFGLPHGNGTMFYPFGKDRERATYYTGDWVHGVKQGYGKYYLRGEQLKPAFEGQWQTDMPNELQCKHEFIKTFIIGYRNAINICQLCGKSHDMGYLHPGYNEVLDDSPKYMHI